MKKTALPLALLLLAIPLAAILALVVRIRSELQGQQQRIDTVAQHTEGTWKSFETLEGRLGTQAQVATLKLEELQRLYPQLLQEVHNLRIKPQRLLQATQAGIQSQTQVVATLRDSIVLDTLSVRLFDYEDPYTRIRGVAIGDTQLLQVLTRDTLVQALYRGKRNNPLLWVFSRRRIEQRIALKNPNAQLEYPQTVQIKK